MTDNPTDVSTESVPPSSSSASDKESVLDQNKDTNNCNSKEQVEQEEEEEEGEEEEEEEEEDSDDEDEPVLKYDRLGSSTSTIFSNNDSASTLSVCESFIAIGTHNGFIFIVGFDGSILKRIKAHSATVHCICIDSAEKYISSASVDGHIRILNLKNTSEVYDFDRKRPMRSVALEPDYGNKTTGKFVFGGMAGSLVCIEKGWLGLKEDVIHQGDGPIYTISWQNNLIAWANDEGVRIYDTATSGVVTLIRRSQDSPPGELYRCNLHWADRSTLLIGWADTITVINVTPKEKHSKHLSGKISAIFHLDCMVSSITTFTHPDSLITGYDERNDDKNDKHTGSHDQADASSVRSSTNKQNFLVLAYPEPEEDDDQSSTSRRVGLPAELRIISSEGDLLSSDVVVMQGYQRFGANDYWLSPRPLCSKPQDNQPTNGNANHYHHQQHDHPTESSWYVLSPNGIVHVETRDDRDHLSWLIEKGDYEEAMRNLNKYPHKFQDFDKASIGKKFLDTQIEQGNYEKAASACPSILDGDVDGWETIIFRYYEKAQIDAIYPFIPTKDLQLSKSTYGLFLAHFLRNDHQALYDTIKKWPNTFYDVDKTIEAVEENLEKKHPDSTLLMNCLAELFTKNHNPGKAIPYFLKLQKPGVFELINKSGLYSDIKNQVLLFIEYGEKADPSGHINRHTAIEVLVDHTDEIPVSSVIKQLAKHREYTFEYLCALFDKDPNLVMDYADFQIELYVEFNKDKLMDFLRGSSMYNLEKAYDVCRKNDLVLEMVFLLGKMGDNKQALHIIIQRLDDVERAIDFCREQDDNDLWEDLLIYSESRPTFIRGLLENVGADIDPIRLIRRIKNGLEIPGLRPALIKILQDYNLKSTLMEGCKSVLNSDCRSLSLDLNKKQTSAIFRSGQTHCSDCNESLIELDTIDRKSQSLDSEEGIIIVFYCRHTFHLRCAFPHMTSFPIRPDSSEKDPASILMELDDLHNDFLSSHEQALRNRLQYSRDLIKYAGQVTCKLCRERVKR